MPPDRPARPATHTYRRAQRLTRALEYRAAYAAKLRKSAGPLTVFGRPNGLTTHRLGLAVGRRVGNAIRRNRVKRLIREAFRLARPSLGGDALDLVVRVHPHPEATLNDYRAWFDSAAERIRREHEKRLARGRDPEP